jgi:hypothetical protein
MAKMQPFWWFLAPEVITYWENRCEELPGEWTGDLANWSLSTTRKEGNYSVRGVTEAIAGPNISKPVTNVTPDEYWLLTWCRIDSMHFGGDSLVLLQGGGHQWGFDMFQYPTPASNKWHMYARIDTTIKAGVSGYAYSPATWYLLRMRVRRNYPDAGKSQIDVYVNSTLEATTGKTLLFPDPSVIRLWLNTSYTIMFSDWLRIKNVGW